MVAVNSKRSLDTGYVSKHTRVLHRHGGISIPANAVTLLKYVSERLQRVTVGTMCAYCGYQPNEAARAMHQEVLEKMLAKKAKARLARRSSK